MNNKELNEPTDNTNSLKTTEKIDLSKFSECQTGSTRRKRKCKDMKTRRGIDMAVCVRALTYGEKPICTDKDWCSWVNALPFANSITISNNANVLPKEFYIGMALMLDYETHGETELTADDKMFVTMAGSLADAMTDDYVDDEHCLKYSKPALDTLCNVYNNIQALPHRNDCADDEDDLRRRIISPILKNVCANMGYVFGNWERIITMPVVDLAAKVAFQMGSTSPYILVYNQLKKIAMIYPAITDNRVFKMLDGKANDTESEVLSVLLFFMMLTTGDARRKAVKATMQVETIAAMIDLETECEIVLVLMEHIPSATTRGERDIHERLKHLKMKYMEIHPSGASDLAAIITETENGINKENASIHKISIKSTARQTHQNSNLFLNNNTTTTKSIADEPHTTRKESCENGNPVVEDEIRSNGMREAKIPIPADLFERKPDEAGNYIPRIEYRDAIKLDRLLSYLCDNNYIDNDNGTRMTFVYRMTGRKIYDDFEPLEKIKWGSDKKAQSILYMCKVLFTPNGAKNINPGSYDGAKKFFEADTKGKPFVEMETSYADEDRADKDLVAELKKIFKDS